MTQTSKPSEYAEWQRRSPCRPLDWRWRRACSLATQGRRVRPAQDDALTGLAARFLSWLRAGAPARGRRPASFADVAIARLLHEHGGLTRLAVQARLLAGQDLEAIAACTGLPPATVAMYEALFFNVLDRLRAAAWVVGVAIGHGRGSAPDPEAVLKAFAYGGGPLILGQVWPYLAGPDAARAFRLRPRDLTDLLARRSVALALLPSDDPQESLRLLRYFNFLLVREKSVERLQALELLSDEHIPTGAELAAEILRASPAAPEGEAASFRAGPGLKASGATAAGVAQRGERHGVGEARPPKVLLLPSEEGGGRPQGVPGPGPGRPLGRPGRAGAAGRAPAGTGGGQGRRGGGAAAAGPGPAAAGGGVAGLGLPAVAPRPVEGVA
jgi:hypothetical protein